MNQQVRRGLAVFWVVALGALAAGAAAEETARGEARSMAQALVEVAELPGLSVAVGVRGQVVWSAGFGLANLETPAPVTTETRFRCASVSKVLTVAALMRLAERGVIDLDAPIQTYLPTFPAASSPITLRRLSGHLAGIRHYLPKDFGLPPKPYPRLKDALPIFAADPLVAPPGEKYNYSTYGYTVIGAAMEAATGKGFLEILQAEVFTPLALHHSGGDVRDQILPGRAGIYDRGNDGRIQPADELDLSYKWPGGGLLASPEDLVRFGMAHLGDGYLNTASRAALFTTQKTTAGEETGVGVGWRVGKDWRGRRIYHHSGSQAGARSTLVLYPDDGVVVAVMTHLGNSLRGIEPTAQMLAEPFLPGSTPAEGLPTLAATYQGTFRGEPVSGVITLGPGPGRHHGMVSVPATLAAGLRAQGQPAAAAWPLVTGFHSPQGAALVVASPLGLMPLRWTAMEAGWRGALVLGGETLEVQVLRSLAAALP